MVRSALAVGVSGVALVLAGCGGGDSTPATVQQTTPPTDAQCAILAALHVKAPPRITALEPA